MGYSKIIIVLLTVDKLVLNYWLPGEKAITRPFTFYTLFLTFKGAHFIKGPNSLLSIGSN